MQDLLKVLKAISDETRLRMINILFERECCVCEVMQILDISQPRASHHLIILHDAGILKARREGILTVYSINCDGMRADMAGIINVVKKAMEGNKLVAKDIEKLNLLDESNRRCVQLVQTS